MELLDRIRTCASFSVSECKKDAGKLDLLRRTYFDVFERKLVITCSNCIFDGIIAMQIELKKLKEQPIMSDRKFILRKNALIQMMSGQSYSNANMTDEIAISLIKRNEKYLRFFEKYPENVFDLVNGVTSPPPAPEGEPENTTATELANRHSKAELLKLCEDKGIHHARKTMSKFELAQLITG